MNLTTEKIIFTGPVGAGKTTAIGAVSDEPPVSTDVNCSEQENVIKDTTTVAMDYSYIQLETL
jgi:signal recognition particle receptor subunit beta